MRTIYIKIGFYKEMEADFSLSLTVETDSGAVIELWGEYYNRIPIKKVIVDALDDSIRILSRVYKKSFENLHIAIENIIKDRFNIKREELKDHALMFLKKYNMGIKSVSVTFVSFGEKSRYNSLARKAYELRSRYPPIVKASG